MKVRMMVVTLKAGDASRVIPRLGARLVERGWSVSSIEKPGMELVSVGQLSV